MLRVNDHCAIPEEELSFSAARAGGPGGQHVNTASTAVTLRFNVADSPSLTPGQKARIMERLGSRLTAAGELLVTARDSRSQHANREAARERLAAMLRKALTRRKPRRPTRPTRASQRRRVQSKKHRGRIKQQRKPPGPGE
jgi:ribosome-associated protein